VPDDSWCFQMAGGVPVVTAPAEIDASGGGQLRAMLAEWAARGYTTLVVDLTSTRFCDSAGLTALVRAYQQALVDNGDLRVVLPATGSVPRVFTLAGLDQLIPHFTGLEQALAQVPDGRVRPRGPGSSAGMRSRADRNSPDRAGERNTYGGQPGVRPTPARIRKGGERLRQKQQREQQRRHTRLDRCRPSRTWRR
jgi:anti-sigma B factor antagonist